MDFRTLLLDEFVFLDGGMGTMLHLAPGELPERLNLTEPERVAAVHKAYADAGSRIVYSNTFGANPLKLAGTGVDAAESIKAAVQIAKRAVSGSACVALDIGPTGQLLQEDGPQNLLIPGQGERLPGLLKDHHRPAQAAQLLVAEGQGQGGKGGADLVNDHVGLPVGVTPADGIRPRAKRENKKDAG